tara:strand:+ start:345 stop:845 length:501 start_codon:yes stop_codon:yes gene_type:complete
MADEFSTDISLLMPPEPNEPDKCQPYPNLTPQQSNGACRTREINRTYDPPAPPEYNFATDSRPNIPGDAPASMQQTAQASASQGSNPPKAEGFKLPGPLSNLQTISCKEYALLIFVMWLLQKPDMVRMVVGYFPVSMTSDANIQSVMISVVFTLAFYIAREYLVFM